jgi:YD repeat-containing protein
VQEQDQVRTLIEYEYDQGLLQKETMKNKDGSVISVYEYSYDGQGNRTGRVWKNSRGVKVAETVYAYTDGKLVSSETKNAGGNKINSIEYQYDAQGSRVKQESRDGSGKITSVFTAVWQNGFETRNEFLGADNAVQQRETNTFGADGELIQKLIENIQGKSAQVIKYEYAFK